MPSVNGKAWNGEYWKGSLKSGQVDLQALRKRSLSSLESNKEYADSILNYLAIDAQFFIRKIIQRLRFQIKCCIF